MKNSNIVKHQTEIMQIDNGWQFECLTCGYRATYAKLPDGTMKLVIGFVGNGNEKSADLDSNMNPHLESQIEAILQKYSKTYGEW